MNLVGWESPHSHSQLPSPAAQLAFFPHSFALLPGPMPSRLVYLSQGPQASLPGQHLFC